MAERLARTGRQSSTDRGESGEQLSGGSLPDSGSRPAPRARVRTRAALISAAERLFVEAGTTAVSIDDICAAAGFTRGAFYSNFRTVDDVFFAVYESKTEQLLAGMSHTPDAATPATLDGITDHLLGVIPADREWYALRAMFGLRSASDEARAGAVRAHGEAFREQTTPLLIEMATLLGAQLVPDPDEATRIVIAAHVGSVLQGALVDDPDRLRRDTLRAALRGALTRTRAVALNHQPAPARPIR
ncbi:MAG: TetR/AcrR family transcriptional regulator [Mycetocola sp.]